MKITNSELENIWKDICRNTRCVNCMFCNGMPYDCGSVLRDISKIRTRLQEDERTRTWVISKLKECGLYDKYEHLLQGGMDLERCVKFK